MISSSKFINAAPAVLAFIPGSLTHGTSDRVHVSNQNFVQDLSFSFKVKTSKSDIEDTTSSKILLKTPEWDDVKQARFDELAIMHALDETNSAEEFELQQLQAMRLQEFAPRSYEEVRHEFEIEKATNNAIQAIDTLLGSFTGRWAT